MSEGSKESMFGYVFFGLFILVFGGSWLFSLLVIPPQEKEFESYCEEKELEPVGFIYNGMFNVDGIECKKVLEDKIIVYSIKEKYGEKIVIREKELKILEEE